MNGTRLLLIEDDKIDQLAFKRHVLSEKLPYEYEIVKSLADAKAILSTREFDVIISDFNLGDGTALDVRPLAPNVPLIIITGAGNEEIAVKALKAGAYDYLIKDAERNYLKVLPLTVEKAVKSYRADKQMKMLLHAIMHISDSVYVTDTNGVILFANKAFCENYGYTPEEATGLLASSFGDQNTDGEWLHQRKDGSTFFVSLSKSIIRDANEAITAIVAVARDSSERKRQEEALRASEEQYRQFFDDDLAGAFVSTPDGKLLACNPSFARIFGFNTVEEARQHNFISFFPNSRQFGELFDLVRLNKKLEHHELQLRRRDGKPVYIIQNVFGNFSSETKELIEIKGYIFDNTRHRLLEEQLRQAQKMEGIGTLAGGIAHDFNNILAIIMGHTHILMKGNPEMIKRANSVDTIDRAVKRGAKLVKQILTFARRDEIVFEAISLNQIIEELQKMLAETFPKMIDFSLKLDQALPLTVADQSQVHQALLNLCVNARDAMPNGGTLRIESELQRGLFLRERYSDAKEHLYACIRVADTGTGMPPEVLSRMFEPFFTTKEIGKGTGLGLAVVYGVTKSHQGFVDVSSQVGKGTTFTLYFPIRREECEQTESEIEMDEEQTTNETILVVEDEEMLLELVKGMLEGKGYNVLSALDGAQAIDIYAKRKDEIGLVLTDLGLPNIDGWEAFKRMKEINPEVKVIFASGYIDDTLRKNLLNAGAKDLVGKPYMPEEILNRVREQIGSGAMAN